MTRTTERPVAVSANKEPLCMRRSAVAVRGHIGMAAFVAGSVHDNYSTFFR
jgi:hypothetical protein